MIKEYSPNTSWGKQVVKLTLMQWAYQKTFTVEVGGNCTGLSVMEAAIDNLMEELLVGEVARVVLANPAGEELHCEDEEDRGDSWLKDMLVSCEIVDWKPPTVNEIRKMNGAAPLADGNQPWQPL